MSLALQYVVTAIRNAKSLVVMGHVDQAEEHFTNDLIVNGDTWWIVTDMDLFHELFDVAFRELVTEDAVAAILPSYMSEPVIA